MTDDAARHAADRDGSADGGAAFDRDLGARILAENCGQTVERILKDFDRDRWMDAQESVAYGIVDGVMERLS